MPAPPRLILVPGLDGTGLLFAPFQQSWSGPSTVLPLPADPALGYAGLLDHLRTVLPRDEPYILLGESFSGPLVLRIAETPPPGLLGLILCVTFARYPLGILGGLARMLARPGLLGLLPRAFLRRRLLGNDRSPELLGLLAEVEGRTPPAVIAARLRAVTRVDATASLRACRVPLLVLSARSDAVVPAGCTRHLLDHAPAADWVEFPGPHLLLQTRPEAAATAIEDFLRKHNLMTTGQ
jgi:pimeloyl-ACP methyl ester carboxylesterase